MVVGATTAARGGAASRLAAADAAALSVSLSPFLPSSVEEEPASRADADGAAAPPATVGRKRTVRFEPEAAAFQPTHAVFTPKLSETGELRYRKPDDRVSSLAPPDAARSTLAQPNYDDFLRRVSVVLYQHLRRCEKRHREQQRVAKGQLLPPTAAAFHSSLDGHGPLTESRAPAPTEEDEDDDEMLLHPASEDSNAPTAMTTRSGSSASLAVDLPVDEVFREEHFVTPQYKYTFLRLPRVHPLTAFAMQKVSSRRHVPSVDEIFRFCKHLFNQAQLSAECSIVCLIYIERLMEQAGVPLLVASWKPIVLCGLLLASKVWQDLSSWNVEIATIYPQYSLHAINRLERLFLHHIQWDLYISASVYAKYYFALRSLTEKKDFRRRYNYTMRVDPPNSRRLEERSAAVKHELYSKSL